MADSAQTKGNPGWKYAPGTRVFEPSQAKAMPTDIYVYTVTEQRPGMSNPGERTYLCTEINSGSEMFLEEREIAEWTAKTKAGVDKAKERGDRSNSKPWERSDRGQKQAPKSTDRAKPTPERSAPAYNSTRPKMGMAGKFLVFSVLGCATVLSQQIWLSYGDTILAQIHRVPLLGLIEMVPMVGGVVKFFGSWFPDVLGIGIWFMINASQSGKDLIKLLDIRDPWWVAQLTAWSEPHKVAIAYAVEIALAYNKYPILPGGLNDLLENVKAIDPEMINWLNIPLLLLSVLSFEYLIKFFTVKAVGGKRGSVGAAV